MVETELLLSSIAQDYDKDTQDETEKSDDSAENPKEG